MSTPVNRDHVLWAYRLFLGREPENDVVVEHHLRHTGTTDGLIRAFLNSTEFLSRRENRFEQKDGGSSLIHIDQIRSRDALEALLEHVGQQWSKLGKEEPHWSVITDEAFRSQAIGKNIHLFRESGVNEVNHITSVLERNGLSWPTQGRALEYGCGVGRVSLPLAAKCGEVVGIDISAAHLQLAAAEAQAQGLTHKIRWLQVKGLNDLELLPQAQFIYSRIVLQHNPPPIIEILLHILLRKLTLGGIAVFQVPTHMQGYSFHVDDYIRALRTGGNRGIEMHMLPQRRIFELVLQAGCAPCEIFADDAAGPLYTSHTFVVRKVSGA